MRPQRQKPGVLEADILATATALREHGQSEFYGLQMARLLRAEAARRAGVPVAVYAYGPATSQVCKVADQLEQRGVLASRREDRSEAAGEGRPLRRLYHLVS